MKPNNTNKYNKVILNLIQDLQRLSLVLLNNLRGRFQIKFGMTTLCTAPISRIETLRDDEGRKGFTLIELLVVVLIIGILAAVALPQYQVAVKKSRYTQLITLTDACERAQQIYRLANGDYADNFEVLDIDMPAGTMNTNKPSITYPSFVLTVTQQFCASTSEDLDYYHYMSGRMDCRSSTNIGKKVCKAMGGKLKAGHPDSIFFL